MRLLESVREDDIFLLLDADELPNKESLLFLKLFDGLVFKHILTKCSYWSFKGGQNLSSLVFAGQSSASSG